LTFDLDNHIFARNKFVCLGYLSRLEGTDIMIIIMIEYERIEAY